MTAVHDRTHELACDRDQARVRLHDWLIRRNGCIAASDLTDETPLLERRIVTSLQVMDLILFIERLRGAPIKVSQIRPGSFRDIASIIDRFFGDARHG